ncbi:MAG: polysaccharide deacetylase family protein [Candidatus Sumerlaeota bacterium]|nr:polysaccharide deacetylase family protein [Candidatus Sumerlaeota bacterium]
MFKQVQSFPALLALFLALSISVARAQTGMGVSAAPNAPQPTALAPTSIAFTPSTPSTPSTQSPASPVPTPSRNKIVLTAEQATGGGHVIPLSDGTKGLCIDNTCKDNATFFEWKLPTALPPGWRHGVVQFGIRDGDDKGYVNTCLGIKSLAPNSPTVSVMSNFVQYIDKNKGPQKFEFWLYSIQPMDGIRIMHIYSQLWRWKRTWPITQVTLEPLEPSSVTPEDVLSLELSVQADGTASLPARMFPGIWQLGAAAKTTGTAVCLGEDGRGVTMPIGGANFYMESPLQKIVFKANPPIKTFTLQNQAVKADKASIDKAPSANAPAGFSLMTTVDTNKTETAQLEMIGANLTGDAPVFPLLPRGKKTAVLTSWDDGTTWDLRMAEVTRKLGIRATFELNQNSQVMGSLDKLEALGAEIGAHCYHHCFLFELPPKTALYECAAMRQFLEEKLKHPIISMAYPNGYSSAYDSDGDYVLRAVRDAGYWSGRTTSPGNEVVDSIAEPMAFKTAGFFGEDKRGLEREWAAIRAREGGVFHIWGHAHQLGKTDEQWKQVEDYLAKFANLPDVWYPTQGEVSTWIWLRKNVQLSVTAKTPTKVNVKLTRPWLHPYLAGKRPLSLKVPAGVEKVTWQGREIPVTNGFVELPWQSPSDAGAKAGEKG